MAVTIAVTGASGRIGSAVLAALRGSDATVRALSRTPDRIEHADSVYADYTEPASLAAALDGVQRAFLITPDADPAAQAPLEAAFCRAAARAGVEHVVKVSAYLAGLPDPAGFGYYQRAAELALERSGISYTHLRPAFLMQTLALFAADIRAGGRLFAPTRGGRVAVVDAADVAACAAHILEHGGFVNQALTITGPEALSFANVAARIAAHTGRPVRFVPVPRLAARVMLTVKERLGWRYSGLVTGLFKAVDEGAEATVHPSVETITGQAPRSLDQFLEEHGGMFMP